jgi:F0F1-type ATP synthase assembly protein I
MEEEDGGVKKKRLVICVCVFVGASICFVVVQRLVLAGWRQKGCVDFISHFSFWVIPHTFFFFV